jgi:ATP-dependent DNA helicase RecQ
MTILELLKKHFGYDQFRPQQEEIIENVINGKDTFVLMPTGGGKSLCYQLPALKLDGITLVISPLIALMKDQVDALQANGVAAEFINSSLTPSEIYKIEERLRKGELKILYIAPERLSLDIFKDFLNTLPISLIAIDEAHCISEWGHDFRPDYRNLKILRKQFAKVPVIALTATATQKVKEDIVNQLGMEKAKVFVSSFNRPNLSYDVIPKKDSFEKLVDLLLKYKNESAIIYCFSRKSTEDLADNLRDQGFNVLAYHAGLETEKRKKTQEKFIKDEVQIIVATIAFGMGIDKPNVRLVVHNDLPKSIEGYYQETGRAGRDGLPSECILFYSYGDKVKQDFFIRQISDEAEKENANRKLAEVISYAEHEICRRKFLLEYFGESWSDENCGGCDLCLTPAEEFDATIIAQKVISAIIRTGQSFGEAHIRNVLLGKKIARVQQYGHHELSVFGIVKEYGEDELRNIIKKLIDKNLIQKTAGEYPILLITNDGMRFIQDKEEIVLTKSKSKKTAQIIKNSENYDTSLFEELRSLRKQIAAERNVPPFVIFGDNSLREMSTIFPQSLETFSTISGVGREKLERFGLEFVKVIKKYCITNNISEKSIRIKTLKRSSSNKRKINSKSSTYEKTRLLVEQKLSIPAMVKARKVAENTIIDHIEKLKTLNPSINIDYLKPDAKKFKTIKEAFKKTGGTLLTPVKELLGDDYSYRDLKLTRLFL